MARDPDVGEERALRRRRRLTVSLFAVGFSSAIALYLAAGPEAENPLGYDPLESKRYIHDMEVYGGKANVLAAEFREWFASLWHGRNLSYTVAVLTVVLVLIVRFFTTPLSPEDEEAPENVVDLRRRAGR